MCGIFLLVFNATKKTTTIKKELNPEWLLNYFSTILLVVFQSNNEGFILIIFLNNKKALFGIVYLPNLERD